MNDNENMSRPTKLEFPAYAGYERRLDMTDKEKITFTADAIPDTYTFEDFVVHYIGKYWKDFPVSRLLYLQRYIQQECLEYKITSLERAHRIAAERSMFLDLYLSGELWPDEEEAKRNLEPQINNARAIREACREV